jgi:hypothetical protein
MRGRSVASLRLRPAATGWRDRRRTIERSSTAHRGSVLKPDASAEVGELARAGHRECVPHRHLANARVKQSLPQPRTQPRRSPLEVLVRQGGWSPRRSWDRGSPMPAWALRQYAPLGDCAARRSGLTPECHARPPPPQGAPKTVLLHSASASLGPPAPTPGSEEVGPGARRVLLGSSRGAQGRP